MEEQNKKAEWTGITQWHDSGQIDQTRYFNGEKGILEIKFKGGQIYHYYGVPENLYIDMLKAPSGGVFLSQYIKGKYNYKKI